jgi:hypothetical protein
MAVQRRDEDGVIAPDVSQVSKEAVAVAGESDISRLAGKGRTRDVPDRQTQVPRLDAFDDYSRNTYAGYFNTTERRSRSKDMPEVSPCTFRRRDRLRGR